MDEKQNIILSVLYLLEKIWGRTYLQKFLYLLNREVFNEKLFDYEPYKYGPFCSDINEVIFSVHNLIIGDCFGRVLGLAMTVSKILK